MVKIGRPIEVNPDHGQKVSDRIKQIRKKLSYSQKDVADALGVTSQTIGGWERGVRLPNEENISIVLSWIKKNLGKVDVDLSIEQNQLDEKVLYDFDLAENMKKVRQKNEWSQRQLGNQVGVGKDTIYKWENLLTNPTGDNMIAIKEIIERHL